MTIDIRPFLPRTFVGKSVGTAIAGTPGNRTRRACHVCGRRGACHGPSRRQPPQPLADAPLSQPEPAGDDSAMREEPPERKRIPVPKTAMGNPLEPVAINPTARGLPGFIRPRLPGPRHAAGLRCGRRSPCAAGARRNNRSRSTGSGDIGPETPPDNPQ